MLQKVQPNCWTFLYALRSASIGQGVVWSMRLVDESVAVRAFVHRVYKRRGWDVSTLSVDVQPFSSTASTIGCHFRVMVGPSPASEFESVERLLVKRRAPELVEDEQYRRLQNEADALRYLQHADLDPAITKSIPPLIGYEQETGLMAIGFVPGKMIQRRLFLTLLSGIGLRSTERRLRLAAHWLARFQNATIRDDEQSVRLSSELETAMHVLSNLTGPFAVDTQLYQQFITDMNNEESLLPIAAAQGDFTIRNLLFSDDSVMVIDWEHFQYTHPLFDPLTFCCNLVLTARFGAPVRRITRLCLYFLDAWRECGVSCRVDDRTIALMTAARMINQLAYLQDRVDGRRWKRTIAAMSALTQELAARTSL